MTQPYLCHCGALIDVAHVSPGDTFRCPTCARVEALESRDAALLERGARGGGLFDMLLSERLSREEELPAAEPVTRPASQPAAAGARGAAAAPAFDETRTESTGGAALQRPPASSGGERRLLAADARLGPFRIVRKLGEGGMGTVYEAFDASLERTVALKVLGEELSRDRETVERFQREARSAGSLTHPNITHIYSIGEDRGTHYFAMELVRGRTLADLVAETTTIDVEDALDYLLQIVRGLRAAHAREIIHRDIKPSNLMLSDDGLLKITDFGLAKVVTQPVDITTTGVIIGTPLYMSPEQGRGEPVDHRTDVYALGCTFYHLLSGRPPFSGENAMTIIVRHVTEEPPLLALDSALGERLAGIVRRMMAKNAADRFPSYDALMEALTAITASMSSARLEPVPGKRVVLVSEKGEENLPADSLSLKLLSVADVSMELGRYDKALTLYNTVVRDNPQLEADLSFRVLKIHQQRGNREEAERLYRRILSQTDDVSERYYCRWKLLSAEYEACLARTREAARILEELLAEKLPDAVSMARLRSRLAAQRSLERDLGAELGEGLVLVRRTGDLQIELD